ncbi:beta-N-acetylhexosaminidase [Pseudonocardia sp. CA-107938]|uniref:beta-N-acetylhexosaminidase n=1 Tax=Pseudonocardia sp. CA-107938 TaxID=3240021 RepID=UPI003D8C7224
MTDHPAAGLLPLPSSVELRSGYVEPPGDAAVATEPALRAAALRWRRLAEDAFGAAWDLRGPGPAATQFRVDPALPAGGYVLDVDEDVQVIAADLAGAHAAVATLAQLFGPAAFRRSGSGQVRVPRVRITDAPRCGWRGVLLDVARHFLPKDGVLRMVDLAAAHKLNTLQLHLTDDQGWRMEVRSRPKLTEVGAWRHASMVGAWREGTRDTTPHGGFYTQADLREIVAYATARGVTVVPEIDVPGHSQAAIAAYPELGVPGRPAVEVSTTWGIIDAVLDPSPAVVDAYREILDEVFDVFDAAVVHLGGDEVPLGPWERSPEIVRRAAEFGLTGVADLHGWFVGELARHVVAAGRRPAVWDEALSPALPEGTIVTAWRSGARGSAALAAGYDTVLAPEQHVYLDHRAGDGPDEPVPVGFVRTVDDVYAYEPSAPGGPGRVLGAQAAIWTEHLDSGRRIDFAAFPRLAAFAEVVWTAAERRDPADFRRRLTDHHLPRLDATGVEYRPLAGPLPWQRRPGVPGHVRDLAAELPPT